MTFFIICVKLVQVEKLFARVPPFRAQVLQVIQKDQTIIDVVGVLSNVDCFNKRGQNFDFFKNQLKIHTLGCLSGAGHSAPPALTTWTTAHLTLWLLDSFLLFNLWLGNWRWRLTTVGATAALINWLLLSQPRNTNMIDRHCNHIRSFVVK